MCLLITLLFYYNFQLLYIDIMTKKSNVILVESNMRLEFFNFLLGFLNSEFIILI